MASPVLGPPEPDFLHIILSNKGAAGALVALDETSGAVRWQVANGDGGTVFDVVRVTRKLRAAPRSLLRRAAILRHSNRCMPPWQWNWIERPTSVSRSLPVIAGGVVYQTPNEQVVAISAADGRCSGAHQRSAAQHVGSDGLSVVTGG